MAHYIFVVNVATDDNNVDSPTARDIRNEILNNLEWSSADGYFERVTVRQVHALGGIDAALEGDNNA